MDLNQDEVTKRIHHAAESILENEGLTTGLDDESAQAVIDWGLACAQKIMTNTAGLNDEEAEKLTYPQLKATRRLMRSVRQWIIKQSEGDAEAAQQSFQKIIKQTQTIYGNNINLSDTVTAPALSDPDSTETPPQRIAKLRTAVESGPAADPDKKPNQIY